MKKHILPIAATFLLSATAYGQVGINTETPKATLDVVASPADVTKTDGFIAPRLKGSELKAKDALYAVPQTGAIVYVTEALLPASTTVKTTNVTTVGYFYFDGTIWQKVGSGSDATGTEPWYNQADGTQATANTQNIYQTGNVAIGTQNGKGTFHIDGGKDNPTDATTPLTPAQNANDFVVFPGGRVGIKTASPAYTLDINHDVNSGSAALNSGVNIGMRLLQPNNGKSILQKMTTYNSDGVEKTIHLGIAPELNDKNGIFSLGRMTGTTTSTDFRMDLANGNVGLGYDPDSDGKLLVGGNLKVRVNNGNYGNLNENTGVKFVNTLDTANPLVSSITAGSTNPTGWNDSGKYMNFDVYDTGFNNALMTLRWDKVDSQKRVGINTTDPKTTLDVSAKRDTGGVIVDNAQLVGLQAPRLTRAELTANTAAYTTQHAGAMIYITNVSGGDTGGRRTYVDAIGYYYYDSVSNKWMKMTPAAGAASEPWYNQADGTQATANNQNIYQMGNVAINKNTAVTGVSLDVNGAVRAGTAHTGTIGANSAAFGNGNNVSGENSAAFGTGNIVSGPKSFAAGDGNKVNGGLYGDFALGGQNTANGGYSVAVGFKSSATGPQSFAAGQSEASGWMSVALNSSIAPGEAALSGGFATEASGQTSFAMGDGSKASGKMSTALGGQTIASGDNSTAMGYGGEAKGDTSTVMGWKTIASSKNETVIGSWNAITTGSADWPFVATDALFQIGNSDNSAVRSNAMTVLKSGKTKIGGKHTTIPNLTLEVEGTDGMKVPTGTTAQRPASAPFGTLRYNTTTGRGEMYVNDANGDGTQGDAGWIAF